MKAEYIEDSGFATEKVKILYRRRKPRQAIILAAGFGMRMQSTRKCQRDFWKSMESH